MDLLEKIKTGIKQHNNFSLTYDGCLTADWGDFVPIVCKEMVPTDKFTANSQVFVRMSPLASPTYGRIHGYINHFFVPNRILMPEEEFNQSITGGERGDYPETFPFITYSAIRALYLEIDRLYSGFSSLRRARKVFSYLGLGDMFEEIGSNDVYDDAGFDSEDNSISLLPFLALFRIYYDYYAPLGLGTIEDVTLREVFTHKYSGLVTSSNTADITRLASAFGILSTCYNKDYFTTAFDRPQRGAASLAPIEIASTALNPGLVVGSTNTAANTATNALLSVTPQGNVRTSRTTNNTSNVIGQVSAHVLNYATKIQQFLERNNIAGGRSFEQMLARFGVKLSNEQLQRSQYLSGKDFWIQVSDVTSTSWTGDDEYGKLGSQAGKGIGLGRGDSVTYSSDEYGFFISLFHFVPETNGLVDGLERMWTRHDKFDYWQPEVEDAGMRPIKNKELNRHLAYYPSSVAGQLLAGNPDGSFGYTPQYAEYKFANPILGGDFVLTQGIFGKQIMDSYHLYRRIGVDDQFLGSDAPETPVLGVDFCSILGVDAGQNNFNRIFQNTTWQFDHFIINLQVSIGANRPMIGYAEASMEFTEDEEGNARVNLPYGGTRL